jgi:hypothetical protein
LTASGPELLFESFNLLPNGTLIFRAVAPDSGNETTAQIGVRLQGDDSKGRTPATAVRTFNLTVRFHVLPVASTSTTSANSTTAAAATLLTQQAMPTTTTTTPTTQQQPLEISFSVVPQVVTVEGTVLHLPGFVHNIRGMSPAFVATIRPANSGNASAAGITAPEVSPEGGLRLSVQQGLFGRFLLIIEWAGKNNNSCAAPFMCAAPALGVAEPAKRATAMLVVLPLPRVLAVVPALGPSRGSTLITVHGAHFSAESRPLPPAHSSTHPPQWSAGRNPTSHLSCQPATC